MIVCAMMFCIAGLAQQAKPTLTSLEGSPGEFKFEHDVFEFGKITVDLHPLRGVGSHAANARLQSLSNSFLNQENANGNGKQVNGSHGVHRDYHRNRCWQAFRSPSDSLSDDLRHN